VTIASVFITFVDMVLCVSGWGGLASIAGCDGRKARGGGEREREKERKKKGAESRWILFVEVMTVD
jgi:hypothetical protein